MNRYVITSTITGIVIKEGRRIITAQCLGDMHRYPDARTAVEVSPAGVDSCPLMMKRAIYVDTMSSAVSVMVGYVDDKKISKPGESRLYSQDTDGNILYNVRLMADGTCRMGQSIDPADYTDNLVRYSKLEDAFNDLQNKYNDLATKWNSFVSIYKAGSPTVQGLPLDLSGNDVSSSTADITLAKIDKLKIEPA